MFPSGLPEEITRAMLQAKMKWTEKQLLEENTTVGLKYLELVMKKQNEREEQESRRAQSMAKMRH